MTEDSRQEEHSHPWSAWEEWGRPLLLLLSLITLGLCWYLKWVADAHLAMILGIAIILATGAIAVSTQEHRSRGRLLLSALVAICAALVAGAAPWWLCAPESIIFEGDFERPGQALVLPPTSHHLDNLLLVFEGRPKTGQSRAELEVRVQPPDQRGQWKKSSFSSTTTHKGAQSSRQKESHQFTWSLAIDLSMGATISMETDSEHRLEHPVHLVARRGPRSPIHLWWAILPLVIIAASLDSTLMSMRKGRITTFVMGCAASGPCFGALFQPEALSMTVLFTALLAALAAGLIAPVPIRIASQINRRKTQSNPMVEGD